MFEFSVARKYLVPRVRQLSVSIISLISVFVIATVVWLSIVFFSIQEGVERSWTEKMVALTSPLRLTPTDAYYKSYYYLIDSYIEASNYTLKSLREKLNAKTINSYDSSRDPSLPSNFPKATTLDIVKETLQAISSIPGVTPSIFDTASANLKLQLFRDYGPQNTPALQQISTTVYLLSLEPNNSRLGKSLLKPTNFDLQNWQEISTYYNLPQDKLWINKSKDGWIMPQDPRRGTGIALPKGFRDSGVELGDQGELYYQGFGASTPQEMHMKVFVAGFYDPGIIPLGGKIILANPDTVAEIQSASLADDRQGSSGFNVDFADLRQAQTIKQEIVNRLNNLGLAAYWNVQTYDEYEFTKDIFQQMRSDKNLFSLISVIITIVACSNIISMLIILVHDKRKEIAIMRALGATKASIAFIFGLSGFILGAVGSLIGTGFAILTLKNITSILAALSSLQGFEVLNSTFYANTLPNEVSGSSLLFVMCIASVGSMIAGMVPAIQASRINTSEALRNE